MGSLGAQGVWQRGQIQLPRPHVDGVLERRFEIVAFTRWIDCRLPIESIEGDVVTFYYENLPAEASLQMEFVLVEHMDEVLTHAMILEDGSSLFRNSDIPLAISTEDQDEKRPLI